MRIFCDARRSVRRATGIGRFIEGLLTAASSRDPSNEFLFVVGPDSPLRALSRDNVQVRVVDWPLNSLRINVVAPLVAREWRADVAYFPFWLAPLWMPCPVAVAIHDLIPEFQPRGFSASHRMMHRHYGGAIARRASRVHVLASYGQRELARELGVPAERIDVVSPGIIIPDVTTPDDERRKPFALYVGNHKPHKNLDRMLRAFARIAGKMESDLVIVGARSSTEDPNGLPHQRLINELGIGGRVRLVGQVSDVELGALDRTARFFVFPSLYEGFGLPPLEAMAVGTPVACSATTSLPDVVGDAAVMFDPLDDESIAGAMLRLDSSAELRRDLAARGRARAELFSWNRSADAWLASLRAVTLVRGGT